MSITKEIISHASPDKRHASVRHDVTSGTVKRILLSMIAGASIGLCIEALLVHRVQLRKSPVEEMLLNMKQNFSRQGSLRASDSQKAKSPEEIRLFQEYHGDYSSIVDFAVIAFPKTGTSTMMAYLSNVAYVPQEEWCHLNRKVPVPDLLALNLQEEYPIHDRPRGIKCPRDLEQGLATIKKYYPTTKLIVGVRHPIEWFESFYNFAVNNNQNGKLGPTTEHIGQCYGTLVCTNRGQFHLWLARLGKTPLASNEELRLLPPPFVKRTQKAGGVQPSIAKVFLYDLSQLSDADSTRSTQYRKDLASFLDVHEDLPPIKKVKPGKKWEAEHQEHRDNNKINICDEEHSLVRSVLLDIGRNASKWIIEYFINSKDVTVSNRDSFVEAVRRWEHDPCQGISTPERV